MYKHIKKQTNNRLTQLGIPIVIAVLLCAGGTAGAQETPAMSLDGYVAEAVRNNPKIQAAYNEWKAAEYKIKEVKSLADPMATYGKFGEEVQTKVGPQKQKYGVAQKVPFPGKRHLRGKAQAKQAGMLKEKYEAVQNDIIRDVQYVYFDLFWADQAIAINEEEKSLLEKLEKVAQRKYESNRIAQQNVIKVQVELSKIIQKLFLLRQNRDSLEAKFNSLLNRPDGTGIPKILSVKDTPFDYELDELVASMHESRQELKAAGLSVEKAEYEKTLAKMNYLPDFTFGAEFVDIGGGTTTLANDGEDAWMGMVSVNVPIWFGRLHAQLKEKEAALKAAEAHKEDVENNVDFEAQDIYFKIKATKDIVLLYETALVPQAEQAFDASQTGFEAGVISFLDWLDTERTYLQTRLAYYKAVADYHKSIATLERVVGHTLNGGSHEQ